MVKGKALVFFVRGIEIDWCPDTEIIHPCSDFWREIFLKTIDLDPLESESLQVNHW